QLTDEDNDNFGVPYDYGSDLHYGAYDFSINGQAVLVANDPDYINTMGQRKTLTFNDYKMVNTLYECSDKCPKQLPCQNGGYTSPKNCNVCVCNDFYSGTYCEKPALTPENLTAVNSLFNTGYNKAIYNSGNGYNWDMF
ncbi:hypothetical protein PMAYCL1PPCAC_10640, partial [Pristionchus mayeri]